MQSGGTGVDDVIFDHHFVFAIDAKLSPSNDFIITISLLTQFPYVTMYMMDGRRGGADVYRGVCCLCHVFKLIVWSSFFIIAHRGVSSFLKLGGQVVMRHDYRRHITKLTKTGWAIANPAHPPLSPLAQVTPFFNKAMKVNAYISIMLLYLDLYRQIFKNDAKTLCWRI